MIVALLGVHGVGKSHTAKILSKRGFKHRTIEVIDLVSGFSPLNRQLFFFASYVQEYLSIWKEYKDTGEHIVIDTHPLIVLPYTIYWLRYGGVGEHEITDIVSAMFTLIMKLPKPDVLVLIHPNNIETVLETISERNRTNVSEELNKEYVTFITNWLYTSFKIIGGEIAKNSVIIPAEWEGEERVAAIIERINMSPQK